MQTLRRVYTSADLSVRLPKVCTQWLDPVCASLRSITHAIWFLCPAHFVCHCVWYQLSTQKTTVEDWIRKGRGFYIQGMSSSKMSALGYFLQQCQSASEVTWRNINQPLCHSYTSQCRGLFRSSIGIKTTKKLKGRSSGEEALNEGETGRLQE